MGKNDEIARMLNTRTVKYRYGKLQVYIAEERRWYNLTKDELAFIARQGGVRIATVAPRRTRVQKKEATPLERELESLPGPLRYALESIMRDPKLSWAVRELTPRGTELGHPLKPLLIGVGVERQAREIVDNTLDRQLWTAPLVSRSFSDVIIGGGLHAAIYCAVRAANGYPKPLVLEQLGSAGGTFNVTHKPGFFLNSRNRPGPLSIPGDMEGALNVLPGAVLQPSDLGGAEYLTNDQVAFAVRIALAMYAEVHTGVEVGSVAASNSAGAMIDTNLGKVTTNRLLYATGPGRPQRLISHPRCLTFEDFMRRTESMYPLRGMKRVAVIGAGDSGKTVIETLTGQGPSLGLSIASLDRPAVIDWYGPGSSATCDTWVSVNRNRYSRIGKLLPPNRGAASRVRPLNRASTVDPGFNCVYVDGKPYDHVIDCRGFVGVGCPGLSPYNLADAVIVGNASKEVARQAVDTPVFQIGVCSNIEVEESEAATLSGIGENSTSIFRYGSRVSTLANMQT